MGARCFKGPLSCLPWPPAASPLTCQRVMVLLLLFVGPQLDGLRFSAHGLFFFFWHAPMGGGVLSPRDARAPARGPVVCVLAPGGVHGAGPGQEATVFFSERRHEMVRRVCVRPKKRPCFPPGFRANPCTIYTTEKDKNKNQHTSHRRPALTATRHPINPSAISWCVAAANPAFTAAASCSSPVHHA